MLKGIYSAAAGMTSQMVLTDITANNLANLSTPGFKGTGANFKTFGEALVNRLGNNKSEEIGRFAQGAQVMNSTTNFRQGDLMQTGNTLDLALKGDGFFTVRQQNDTVVYTRAGSFTRDDEGYLSTPDGGRVQGDGGDILIPKGAREIEINSTGDVVVDGKAVDRIKVAQFENNQDLEHAGLNYFKTTAQPTGEADDVTVEQGYIERSNTNAITELVSSMTGLRVYEMLQRSIQMQNETLGKSVNEVGRVS